MAKKKKAKKKAGKKKTVKKKKKKKKKKKATKKKTVKKKKKERKPTEEEILRDAGKDDDRLFGVHGQDTVFCHLCERYMENIEVLAEHLSAEHDTTLTEYQRSFSTDRINISKNTVRAAEFFDAISFRATHGRWPPWFKQGEGIEFPEGKGAYASPLLDSLVLMVHEHAKQLLIRGGIGMRNLLTHKAVDGSQPLLTITMVKAAAASLDQAASLLTDLMGVQIAAKKAQVSSGPELVVIQDNSRTKLVDARTVHLHAPVSLGESGGRAELQRGASLVAGLLTGQRDTHVPPTQRENMEKLEKRIHDDQ